MGWREVLHKHQEFVKFKEIIPTQETSQVSQILTNKQVEISHRREETSQSSQLLTEEATECFEERAAIMEFDGGLSRAEAERLAYRETTSKLGQGNPNITLMLPPGNTP